MIRKKNNLPRVFPAWRLLPIAGSILLLAACLRQSDESILRREFEVPATATLIQLEAFPKESGWFGREGLKIDAVFQLSDRDFDDYLGTARASEQWRELPIPKDFLMHLGAIASARRARLRGYELTGEQPPPEGSVYNPTEEQLFARFVQTLPLQAGPGWDQCRSAGDDILYHPKVIHLTLDHDLNDFMLAVLDVEKKQLAIKVSTSY